MGGREVKGTQRRRGREGKGDPEEEREGGKDDLEEREGGREGGR